MNYPIKYIENNLVWNTDGECFAYYELIPYNYSFLRPDQKHQVHDSFRQLIAQNRDGKIHALQISNVHCLAMITLSFYRLKPRTQEGKFLFLNNMFLS